jgi:hypothetical protein
VGFPTGINSPTGTGMGEKAPPRVFTGMGRAGQKTRDSVTRSTRLISDSTRLGSFKMSHELS